MQNDIKFIARIKNFNFLTYFLGGVFLILLFLFGFLPLDSQRNYLETRAMSVSSSKVIVVTLPAPTGLTATAIGPYQINLSWETTSGAVSYNIYREGVFIASTTNTYYSDSGLSPSTNYTYRVSAIANNGSESALSGPASATTLALPASSEGGALFIPPPPGNSSIVINNSSIYTNYLNVSLELFAKNAYQMIISNDPHFSGATWENYNNSKAWFLTPEDGEKTVYARFRSFAGGVSDVVSDSIIFDSTPPLNVSNLEAEAKDREIRLKWENPPDKDFSEVMIMRSTTFYPTHIYEGILVYKGADAFFLDKGVENGIRYYYTVFSYDKIGNRSSGAVVSGLPRVSLIPGIPPEFPPEIPSGIPSEWPPEIPPEKLPPGIRELNLEDFDFIQEGKKLPIFDKKTVRIEPEKPLTISIDYEKLPEVLKTIMVALKKDGKTFSFLLKIDGEKKKYLAVILPPEPRIYPFDIFVVNYKNQTLKKIPGEMIIRKIGILGPEMGWDKIQKFEVKFPILWLIILLVFLTYIIRKERKKRKEENLKKQEIEKIRKNGFDGLDNYFKKE